MTFLCKYRKLIELISLKSVFVENHGLLSGIDIVPIYTQLISH